MKPYGTENEFPVGLLWPLLESLDGEGERSDSRKPALTMAWPSGYSAKTEFNMDSFGNLSNGREEQLVTIDKLRAQNERFAEVARGKKEGVEGMEYSIMGRTLVGAATVPFNELIVNVGGSNDPSNSKPSLRNGLGRPVALFCRSASFFSLCSLLRARMRLVKLYPNAKFPLFFIDPLTGACCIHEAIQLQLYKNLSCFVNPFRSRHLLEDCMLSLDLDVKKELTMEECASLAGGYGVSDDDVAALFLSTLSGDGDDKEAFETSRKVAFHGLVHSIRASDSRAAQQFVELYTVCGTHGENKTLPPPLDTHTLRQTTKDHNLLVVLGAAEIIKSLQNGEAHERLIEAADALKEWCELGHDKGIKFRLSSWRQHNKAIKSDEELKVSSRMSAFLSHEALQKRAKFALQLQESARCEDIKDILGNLSVMVGKMSKPALRLELLQFALGLESRYDLIMMKESIKLAEGFVTTAKSIVK